MVSLITCSIILGIFLVALKYLLKRESTLQSVILCFLFGPMMVGGLSSIFHGVFAYPFPGQNMEELRITTTLGGLALIYISTSLYKKEIE